MSLDELNELSSQAFLDIADAYAGDDDKEPKRRKATQEDIDRFFR